MSFCRKSRLSPTLEQAEGNQLMFEVQTTNEKYMDKIALYEDVSLQNRMALFPREYYTHSVEDLETDLTAEIVEDEEATVERPIEDDASHGFSNFSEDPTDNNPIYKDASLQQRLTTFPRQYYTLAFAVEDSESVLAAQVDEDEETTVDNIAEDVVNYVFFSLQMEEEAACMRFVDDFVTSVIHNAVSFVEAEEEDAILDRAAKNIISDIIEKVSCDVSLDNLISITINRAMSYADVISCRQIKDSPGAKTSQTESSSGIEQDSDCIQQSMTHPLYLETTPAASEPVLMGHHESVNKLTTSTTHMADFEIPDSDLSEAVQGGTSALGQPAASEMLQREMDQAPHPRRRSAGDVARNVFRTLSRPFRRRRRPRQVRDVTVRPVTVMGLKVEKQDLDLGSTCHKPRAGPNSKDPSGTEMQSLTKVIELPDQGTYKSPSPTGSTNKTHHKELRSDPSYIDPREITQTEPTKVLKIDEISQREADPANRPMKRTRTQRLLRGIGQSLTRLGRPFVACGGG